MDSDSPFKPHKGGLSDNDFMLMPSPSQWLSSPMMNIQMECLSPEGSRMSFTMSSPMGPLGPQVTGETPLLRKMLNDQSSNLSFSPSIFSPPDVKVNVSSSAAAAAAASSSSSSSSSSKLPPKKREISAIGAGTGHTPGCGEKFNDKSGLAFQDFSIFSTLELQQGFADGSPYKQLGHQQQQVQNRSFAPADESWLDPFAIHASSSSSSSTSISNAGVATDSAGSKTSLGSQAVVKLKKVKELKPKIPRAPKKKEKEVKLKEKAEKASTTTAAAAAAKAAILSQEKLSPTSVALNVSMNSDLSPRSELLNTSGVTSVDGSSPVAPGSSSSSSSSSNSSRVAGANDTSFTSSSPVITSDMSLPLSPVGYSVYPGVGKTKNVTATTVVLSAEVSSGDTDYSMNAGGGTTEPTVQCNCKKSRCLKLYCDCFAILKDCGKLCKCVGCNNNPDSQEERAKAIIVAKERNTLAFQSKISKTLDQHHSGCHCKNSHCLKKYCECYTGNAFCGTNCKCLSCQNFQGSAELVKARSNPEGSTSHSKKRKESPNSIVGLKDEKSFKLRNTPDSTFKALQKTEGGLLRLKNQPGSGITDSASSYGSHGGSIDHNHLCATGGGGGEGFTGTPLSTGTPYSVYNSSGGVDASGSSSSSSSTPGGNAVALGGGMSGYGYIPIDSVGYNQPGYAVPKQGVNLPLTSAPSSAERKRMTQQHFLSLPPQSVTETAYYQHQLQRQQQQQQQQRQHQAKNKLSLEDTPSASTTTTVSKNSGSRRRVQFEESNYSANNSMQCSSTTQQGSRSVPVYPFFGPSLPQTPKIVAIKCLDYLSEKDITKMAQVNWIWHTAANDKSLWE